MKTRFLGLIFLGLLHACGGENADTASQDAGTDAPVGVDHPMIREFELMKEDRASDMALKWQGAFTRSAFFSPEGSLVKTGVGEIRGPEAIQLAYDQGLSSGSSVGLTWAAERAEVSNNGDLGYTVGYYQVDSLGDEGARSRVRGMYVNIWRRQPDGTWKIELSIRTPTTPPNVISEGGSG